MPFRREEMISITVCEIAAANLHRRLSSLLALPSRLGKDYIALSSWCSSDSQAGTRPKHRDGVYHAAQLQVRRAALA
jgi:hypothetical protein